MKANEFFKKHGWNDTKVMIESPFGLGEYEYLWDDLKRLVKSHDLVEYYGGIDAANKTICDAFHGSNHPIPAGHEELSLAIQDVESCHVD